jgi:hypothetical protein
MASVNTNALSEVKNFNGSIPFQRFLPSDLKAGSEVLVNVCFSTEVTPEKFYCECPKNEYFANLVCDACDMYITGLEPYLSTLETFAQGMPCLAKNPDDIKKRYQRCEIISIFDGSCHVSFADYPLEINIDKKELYAAPKEIIFGWRKQAICCELFGIVPSCESNETREVRERVFRSWIHEQGTLNCKIKECKSLENEDVVFVVELVGLNVLNFEKLNKIADAIDQEPSVNSKKLTNKCVPGKIFASSVPCRDPLRTVQRETSSDFSESALPNIFSKVLKISIGYKRVMFEEDDFYDCSVISVLTPNRFFVRPCGANEVLANLTKGLHNLYDSSECSKLQFVDTSLFKKDMPAVAKINSTWCRCVIKSVIDHDTIHIALVDYGKEVDISRSSLRHITRKFHKIQQQTVECCGVGIPNNPEWTISAITTFKELLSPTSTIVKILVRRRSLLSGVHEVDIFVDGINVIEKFQANQRKQAEAAAVCV